jgi:hypothetical protein
MKINPHIIFILLIIGLLVCSTKIQEHFEERPILWMYWENIGGKTKPVYLDMCYKTVQKYCVNDFKIILVDNINVNKYLPNLRNDIAKLPIALKVDYIRLKLLHTYGGLWLDQDLIVLKSLKTFTDKLKDFDFVGFCCTGIRCNNGYMRPSNSIMAARKNSVLINRCIELSDQILDKAKITNNYKFEYFDLGKIVVWRALDYLKRTINYKYFHFDSSYTGNRDTDLRWITTKRHISNEDVKFLDESKLHLVLLYHSNLKYDKNKWFLELTKNQILNSDTLIGKMFRRSFDNKVTKLID